MLFFFFFKQKTAYEMRISDWSSDVCSSDLAAAELPALHSTHPGLWAARGTHAGGRTRHPQHPHLALFQRRSGSRAPSISALPFAYPPLPGPNKVRAGSCSPPWPVPESASSKRTVPRAAHHTVKQGNAAAEDDR